MGAGRAAANLAANPLFGVPPGLAAPFQGFLARVLPLCFGSVRRSSVAFRPRLPAAGGVLRLPGSLLRSRGFSPPPCCQGFIGPRSSVLPANLPPRGPSALRGSPWSLRFSARCGNSRGRCPGASPGKVALPHQIRSSFTSVRFTGYQDSLHWPARPPHRSHLAGSLFATDLASTSCFLQTPHCWKRPCLVGVALPSGNGGRLCFTSAPHRGRKQQVRHAGRTTAPPGKPDGGAYLPEVRIAARRGRRAGLYTALGRRTSPRGGAFLPEDLRDPDRAVLQRLRPAVNARHRSRRGSPAGAAH